MKSYYMGCFWDVPEKPSTEGVDKMLFSSPVAEAPGTPDQDVHSGREMSPMASKPSGPI